MDIYQILIFALLLNGLASYLIKKRNYRKWFVISTFFLITIIAALRSTNIGRDLSGHYAANFVLISNTGWADLSRFTVTGMYDVGFVVFCKLISCFSGDPQCFIIITSIITFSSFGRYIYKYSEDVVLESFLLITSFLMFMYMSMIAQVLAISVILFGFEFLLEKKYWKYILFVILATLIHGSAIVCLLFIPLSFLQTKGKYVAGYTAILAVAMVGFDKIIDWAVTYIFPQYRFYFLANAAHNSAEVIQGYELQQILIYVLCAGIGIISLYFLSTGRSSTDKMLAKYERENITFIDNNLLVYLALTAIVCRVMVIYSGIIKRVGYYFFPFAFTLLCRGLGRFNPRVRLFIKIFIYVVFLYFFIRWEPGPGRNSYGVYPYEFFWN